jgi:hypothetical protein
MLEDRLGGPLCKAAGREAFQKARGRAIRPGAGPGSVFQQFADLDFSFRLGGRYHLRRRGLLVGPHRLPGQVSGEW